MGAKTGVSFKFRIASAFKVLGSGNYILFTLTDRGVVADHRLNVPLGAHVEFLGAMQVSVNRSKELLLGEATALGKLKTAQELLKSVDKKIRILE